MRSLRYHKPRIFPRLMTRRAAAHKSANVRNNSDSRRPRFTMRAAAVKGFEAKPSVPLLAATSNSGRAAPVRPEMYPQSLQIDFERACNLDRPHSGFKFGEPSLIIHQTGSVFDFAFEIP